jgi:glycosyltransferase involved in cell wall biosynthesis
MQGVSVVVPCFDESQRLPQLRDGYRRLASMVDEVIIVDDGSTDGSAELVADMFVSDQSSNIRLVELGENVGKGAAVSAGVLEAHGDAVVFMDADLATDLADLTPLVSALDRHDVVIGSRVMPGHVVIGGHWHRSLMGRAFNRFVSLSTGLRLSDTQCGFKAFRSQWARVLFTDLELSRFAFDVEVLLRARSLGLSIGEIPVHWTAVDGSHVHPVRDSWRMLRDVRRLERSITDRRLHTAPASPVRPTAATTGATTTARATTA